LTFVRPVVGRDWPYAALRDKLKEKLLEFVDHADLMSAHVKDQIRAILVKGVRVSTIRNPLDQQPDPP
jgi:hypothetical protein